MSCAVAAIVNDKEKNKTPLLMGFSLSTNRPTQGSPKLLARSLADIIKRLAIPVCCHFFAYFASTSKSVLPPFLGLPERISMFMSFISFDNYCMIAKLHLHQLIHSFLQRRMLVSPL